jgi:2-methylcitrate dehydratase PrpD
MDAMLALVLEHDVRPEQVAAIRLRAGSNILNPLRYRTADSELEAKFCPAFMLASLVLRRKAGINEFTDAFVRSAPVQDMMKKVATVLDPEIEARGFEKMRSIVEIDLADGRRLAREADRYRGGPDHPFTRDELGAKFTECAGLVMDADAAGEVFELLGSLERLDNVRTIVEAVTAGVTRAASPARRASSSR